MPPIDGAKELTYKGWYMPPEIQVKYAFSLSQCLDLPSCTGLIPLALTGSEVVFIMRHNGLSGKDQQPRSCVCASDAWLQPGSDASVL